MAGSVALAFDILARDKASATFNKVGTEVEKTTGRFHKLSKATVAMGLASSAVLLEFGKKSLEAADQFEGAHVRLENAITNTGGSVEEMAGQVAKVNLSLEKFGFTSSETESALARLTLASHSSEKAAGLMGLAADIAKGRNVDLATATDLLAKVQTGHVALLGRLGIATKDVNGRTISQAEALKRLSQMYGGAASRSAETFAGKQAALKAKFTDLEVSVGTKLVPVLNKVADVFLKVTGFVGRNADVLKPLVLVLGSAAAAYFLVTKAIAATNIVLAAMGVETELALGPIGLIIIGVAALAAGLIYAYKHSEMFRKIVDSSFRAVTAAGQFVLNFFKSKWPYLVGVIAGPFGLAAAAIYKHWDSIVGAVSGAGARIKRAAVGIWDGIKTPFVALWNFVQRVFGKIVAAVKEVKRAIDSVTGAAGVAKDHPGAVVKGLGIFGMHFGGIFGATGGIVTRPTMAMIGEAGPEAVVPLNRTPGSSPLRLGGGAVINVTVQGNVTSEKNLAEALRKHLSDAAFRGQRLIY